MLVQQALKTSGLKDDTTCVVVDIIPSDHCSTPPALSPKKNQNKLKSLIFGRRSHSSVGKLSKSASLGSVEEIFEEGSAMLEERHVLVFSCSSCISTPFLHFYAHSWSYSLLAYVDSLLWLVCSRSSAC